MTWYSGGLIYEILPRSAADVTESVTSSENDILTFSLEQEAASATINATAHTVSLQVWAGVSLTALVPTITVSPGATVSPASGATQDFTSAVNYTVTDQDGTPQVWSVTITVSSGLNPDAEITSATLANEITEAALTSNTVVFKMMPSASVTSLTPVFTLSTGASISPTTAQNFTNPVVYTVTAQDGTTKQWTVYVDKS